MERYILLTTLSGGHDAPLEEYEARASRVKDEVQKDCPEIVWIDHYVVMGPFDFLDIIEAPDKPSALKAAAIVRHTARVDVRVYAAAAWHAFENSLP